MKKILYFAMAVIIASLSACNEKPGPQKEDTLDKKILGEWHGRPSSVDADIYISFTEDGKYELYQQIVEGAYRLYRGSWNIEGDIITGKYNDGEDWAAAYTVTMGNGSMTWTSNNDAAEKTTYEKTTVPEEIKETCETIVKSF